MKRPDYDLLAYIGARVEPAVLTPDVLIKAIPLVIGRLSGAERAKCEHCHGRKCKAECVAVATMDRAVRGKR